MFLQPRTLQEAVELFAAHGGMLVAGGTDVFPAQGERRRRKRSSISPASPI
jgi:CO/xanthine dehydrogenase FAD-binding subunit